MQCFAALSVRQHTLLRSLGDCVQTIVSSPCPIGCAARQGLSGEGVWRVQLLPLAAATALYCVVQARLECDVKCDVCSQAGSQLSEL